MSILIPEASAPLDIRLLAAAYLEVGEWWPTTDEIREIWRLYLCEDEGASLRAGEKRFPLTKNRIVLVPAGLEFEAEIRSPVRQFYLHFEFVGWPANIVREILPEPVELEPHPQRDGLARKLLAEVARSEELGPILASRLKALIHLSISEVLSGISERRARIFFRMSEGHQNLVRVLHFIDRHLDQPLYNMRLAEVAMSSESLFIRRFREVTGQTPARYVQDRRVHRAAELLVSTDQTIDQIADCCGFANRYYFTRVFTQRMGCPPARYRSRQPFVPDPSARWKREEQVQAQVH